MIREATEADVPFLKDAMHQLYEHVVKSSEDVYLSQLEEEATISSEQRFTLLLNSPESAIFIAEEHKPIGFIIGTITKPFIEVSKIKTIGYIDSCWVDPEIRHQGIAGQLVNRIEHWFRKQGIEYVDLHYMVGNQTAEKAWEQMGYTPYRIACRRYIQE